MTSDPVRLGAVGLGRGFALTARALAAHPGLSLVAASTRSAKARAAFRTTFNGSVYADYADLLADDTVEMVYVATPHGLHRTHVCEALEAGKHVVVEKPMAISISDAQDMVDKARSTRRTLLVGPSHSYDPPVALAAQIISSGRVGAPKLLHGLMATDYLYRPRRPEELRTEDGGGVIFSQAVHHIDVAMRLLGRPVSTQAVTGAWDADRPTEGAYSALIRFDGGASASLTYSGYGFFDSDIWMGNRSELGVPKSDDTSGQARRTLDRVADEALHKTSRAFTGLDGLPEPTDHEHFGPMVVFCEQGDIRLTPSGVVLYGPEGTEEIAVPFQGSRRAFAEALSTALRGGPIPPQSGDWGLTALKTCHALLRSARERGPVSISEVDHV